MHLRYCCLVLLIAATLARPLAAASTVSDSKRAFSFTLPEDYVENPGGTHEPKLSLAFARGEAGEPGFAMLQVAALGGTIGRGKLDPKIVERAAHDSVRGSGVEITNFEYRQAKWQGFELELLVTRLKREGQALLTLGTQVPLAKEAIQINLAGSEADEARLLADFQTVLASFEGKSNWLTDAERSERLGKGAGTIVGFVAGLAAVVFFLLRQRRRAKARQPRAT
jgi:hypothetical protein